MISPFLPPACRYVPSCSAFAQHAITHHGLMRGMILAIIRLLHCHPWGGMGYDPAPDRFSWQIVWQRMCHGSRDHAFPEER
jgi:putative membrane protein insertion efficiency factor